MSAVFFGIYIPLYTKSSVEKCGDGIQKGEWERNTWGDERLVSREIQDLQVFAAYLLDDGPDVRKALLILCSRPIVSANHLIKFGMSASLDFWM